MDSHFVTLALHIGRVPPQHPPSCHRRAPFSLRQNVSNLEASNVSYPRVVTALAAAIVARNMLESWITSLRSVTGRRGPGIEMVACRLSRSVGQFLRRSGRGAGWRGSYCLARLARSVDGIRWLHDHSPCGSTRHHLHDNGLGR